MLFPLFSHVVDSELGVNSLGPKGCSSHMGHGPLFINVGDIYRTLGIQWDVVALPLFRFVKGRGGGTNSTNLLLGLNIGSKFEDWFVHTRRVGFFK
jgi:hypothetical protein